VQANVISLPISTPAQCQPCFPNLHREQSFPPQIGRFKSENQAFGLSQSEPVKELENAFFDGVLGLGYPSLAIQGTTPVFDNLRKQGQIPEPVFALYLST